LIHFYKRSKGTDVSGISPVNLLQNV